MTEPLLPTWINPLVKQSNDQYIHRILWSENWLTNPHDVTSDMKIVSRTGEHDIHNVRYTDSQTWIYYAGANDGVDVEGDGNTLSISVTNAGEIRDDPNRVIV